MALFFNGQCRVAYSEYFSSQTACKWQRLVSAGHVILHSLPLIGHNLLLVYYQFEYKGNFYKYGLY